VAAQLWSLATAYRLPPTASITRPPHGRL